MAQASVEEYQNAVNKLILIADKLNLAYVNYERVIGEDDLIFFVKDKLPKLTEELGEIGRALNNYDTENLEEELVDLLVISLGLVQLMGDHGLTVIDQVHSKLELKLEELKLYQPDSQHQGCCKSCGVRLDDPELQECYGCQHRHWDEIEYSEPEPEKLIAVQTATS